MHIEHLHFANVGPFPEVQFDFDRQVNVFTGPNNSGKSTVLWVLGDALVYPFSFPKKLLRNNATATFGIRASSGNNFSGELPISRVALHGSDEENGYWTASRWANYVKLLEDVGYTKFIPAMRRPTDFRSPGPSTRQNSLEEDHGSTVSRQRDTLQSWLHMMRSQSAMGRQIPIEPELQRRNTLVSDDPSLVSDEAVIQKIIDLDYRSYLRGNSALRDVVDKITQMATDIAEGFPITFTGVDEDATGFFPSFQTVDGIMPLNTMSQGTQSVIQWLAHLVIGYAEYYDFPKRLEDEPGILIVDEIDAHLHPAWQRGIIPTLTEHFPHLQIFCSTHSPLMLAGLGPGQIQLLTRDEDDVVQVSKNEDSVAGWSADQILRNLLGVRNPTDRKTVDNFDKLEELRTKDQLSPDQAAELERLTSLSETRPSRGSASILIDELMRGIRGIQNDAESL